MNKPFHQTKLGKYYIGDSGKLLANDLHKKLRGKVQLIFTSPPFPLNKKKRYGNQQGKAYLKWFSNLAVIFSDLLTEDGSIVIEMGNAWEPKRPIQSLLPLKSLISFTQNKKAGLQLCQKFVCYNPSRLPSPAQWVTIERIRVIDSYTNIWWMSKTDKPKADNKKVLRPYSNSMKELLFKKKYNSGVRPSEHHISETSFLKDHGGSIMPNVIEIDQMHQESQKRLPENILRIANTNSSDYFMMTCKEKGIIPHPARMPLELASFFIEFLTDPGDIVLDPFAGSNTTGFCAERLKRHWVSIEMNEEYGKQSKIRFKDPIIKHKKRKYTRKVK